SLTVYLMGPALLLAGLLPSALAQPPEPPEKKAHTRRAKAKLVQRVYPVADLVVPLENPAIPNAARAARAYDGPVPPAQTNRNPCTCRTNIPTGPHAPEAPLEDQLMSLIATTIEPTSWNCMGGRGSMDYHALGLALVVNQTPAIQEKV